MTGPATRAQLTKLALLFADHGVADRADRLWLCSDHAGRPLTSSSELTKAQAHELIERLERLERGSLQRVLAARTTDGREAAPIQEARRG